MGARQAQAMRTSWPPTFMGRVGAFIARVLGAVRAYVPNFTDRQQRITQDVVTVDRIESALYQAWLGYMAPLAEINDLIFVHPIIKGLRTQLKAGIKRVAPQVNPPTNVDPGRVALAQTIADDVRNEIENRADAPFSQVVGDRVECALRGGGLIETLWERTPDNRWHWAGFSLVPQQRMRFDRYSGEPAFAETAFQYFGEPVSNFPRGTFIVVTPEKEVPDFSKRGTCRSILTDWFAMQNCAGWWQSDLEFTGSPFVAATYDSDADRETMNRALAEMGAGGKISYRKGGDLKIVERQARTGPKGSPHNEFETTRIQRCSIAFLGETQTVTVSADQGSQQSVDQMADVALDVVAAHWEDILADVRRDLVQIYVELNYGLENADLTPTLAVDLEEPAAAGETLDAYAKGGAIGIEIGEDYARKQLKWPKPGPGEKVLGTPAAEAAPAETSAVGAGPRSVPAPADGTQTNKEAAA